MSPVTITVVLTAFRRTQYLRQAIESVFSQTRPPDQLIIADDSASAEIHDLVSEYVSERTLYLPSSNGPLGAGGNVAQALAISTSSHIAVLNDDDFWAPEYLAQLAEPAEQGYDLVFCDHWVIDELGEVMEEATEASTRQYGRDRLPEGAVRDLAEECLVRQSIPISCAALFRASLLEPGSLARESGGAYDLWIALLLARAGARAYYVPIRLSYFRYHAEAETRRHYPEKGKEQVFMYGRVFDEDWFPNHRRLVKANLRSRLAAYAKTCMSFGNISPARQALRRALALSPSVKTLALYALTFGPVSLRQRGIGKG